MVRLLPVLVMHGDVFSPAKAENKFGMSFSKKNEVGEIGPKGRGRYTGKPIPYGSASLWPPDEVIDPNNSYCGFEWLVNILVRVVEVVRECGADDIYLDLGVFSNTPPNLAFTPEILAKLSSANISFWISCYSED